MRPLNILHVLRAPVGGLFRHVIDLARGQAARGHRVGLICDSSTGGARAQETLAALAPELALGITRTAMPRLAAPGDLAAVWRVTRLASEHQADVLHGHGAKGGAYARFAGAGRAIRAYTPHGGSLHYGRDTLSGRVYLATEKMLMARGDVYLFESAFSEAAYRAKVGNPRGIVRVVHNGVGEADFAVVTPGAGASDVVFLGELRALKGIDVLVDALAALKQRGVTATLIGDGPDRADILARIERHGLQSSVRVEPPMPARAAFARGRVLVVPSRAESLPYVVLEAAAAQVPMIATNVGGIPEIYGPHSSVLVPPENVVALADVIAGTFDRPQAAAELARGLRERVRTEFSLDSMVEAVLAAYAGAKTAS